MTATVAAWKDVGLEASGTDPTWATVDLDAAERALSDLLEALGQPAPEERGKTASRIARAYAELLTPEPFDATIFPNREGYEELVVVKHIAFTSLCEHHLLPFSGTAHVGYLPSARLIGVSKVARIVERFACRLQMQERLTAEVSRWFETHLEPRGVGVVVEAEHACMTIRGARSRGARTVTSSLTGELRDDTLQRAAFLAAIGSR